MTRNVLFATAALGGLMCVNLSASPITGTFNIAGSITVTPTMITWNLADAPFTPDKAVIGSPATGDFSTLAGTMVTIRNLNLATAPVGTTFPAQQFISFDAAPASFPSLNINFIFAGTNGVGGCAA